MKIDWLISEKRGFILDNPHPSDELQTLWRWANTYMNWHFFIENDL